MRASLVGLNRIILFSALFLYIFQVDAQDYDPELGIVTLWRTGEYNHPNLRNRVALDGIHFGNLTKKNYIKIYLPPGDYELEVGHIEFATDSEDPDQDGKWVHPDEGGTFKLSIKPGITYNIMGEMHRKDPSKDTASIDERLMYFVELKRYRGTYGWMQDELSTRKLTKNRAYLYSKVQIVLSSGRKVKSAIILDNNSKTLKFMELGVGYLYEQEVNKSDVRSITLITS